MPLKFHGHPLSSYCWKVLVALYERDIAFDHQTVVLDPNDPQGGGAFRRLWPIARMPLLEDDAGLALPGSSLIIEHLDHIRPGPVAFVPADWEQALKVRFWDRFFDLYVHAPMQKLVLERIRLAHERDPAGAGQARDMLRIACDYAEARLGPGPWATGEAFTMADCAAAPALHYAQKVQPFAATRPGLAAYLRRLETRPSFARVLREAEPYAHMFPAEPATG